MDDISSRIESYIARQAEWARRQCVALRAAICAADPQLIEGWKWNGPCYEREGLVCSFDASKAFVSVTFFRGGEMLDAAKLFNHCVNNEHNRSIRFEKDELIDTGLLAAYVQEAVELNLAGPRAKALPLAARLVVPPALQDLLAAHEDARLAFEAMAAYKRRDYVDWINSAKREETRKQRLEKTLANLRAGLGLNDKYRA